MYGYVGSSNMDLISMNCNMETCLTFLSPEITEQIKSKFDEYKTYSSPVTLEEVRNFSVFGSFMHWLAFHVLRYYVRFFRTFGLGKRESND